MSEPRHEGTGAGARTGGGAIDLAQTDVAQQDYNPLEYVEGVDEEGWEDDDRLILPEAVAPERPEKPVQAAVFSPERAGSVENAVRGLVQTNAARREILLSIVDWARDGIDADELFGRIEAAQADNLSVYEPVSYCRMLERAGALKLEGVDESTGKVAREAGGEPMAREAGGATEPEPPAEPGGATEPDANLDTAEPELEPDLDLEGVTFMEIEDDARPRWFATEGGLNAYDELTRGDEWRDKVLGEDAVYCEVYLAVMQLLHEGGRPKKEIADLAETFEVTRHPRKWGAYFIDVLEATSAIRWSGGQWVLTELGERLLDELAEFCAQAG